MQFVHKSVFRTHTILLLTVLLGWVSTHAQTSEIDLISRNVVQIETDDATGSGLVFPESGELYILTNRHVVEFSTMVQINILKDINEPAEAKFIAELLRFSADYDVALLKIVSYLDGTLLNNSNYICDATQRTFCFNKMTFGDAVSDIKRGEQIGLLGYPGLGENELIYSNGIVSSVKYETINDERIPIWIRTNADMSPGNSGGVAFNAAGELLGMPTYVYTESQTGGRLGNILTYDLVFKVINASDVLTSWDQYSPTLSQLDMSDGTIFGSISLAEGFFPDPHKVSLSAGGVVPVVGLGTECVGHVAQKPDYALNWTGGTTKVHIMFTPDESGYDATLIVYTPDGNWECNDDRNFSSVDPEVILLSPADGTYFIWVGSYHEDTFIPGTLKISELAFESNEFSLDWLQDPNFGSVELVAGFLPDPFEEYMTSGGPVDVEGENLGDECLGWAAEAPDFRLIWTGSASELYFYFEADEEDADTTLIINAPDGSWYCNDDAHLDTFNPALFFTSPAEGQYDIWIGSYSEDTFHSGFLKISEIEPNVK